MLDIIHHEKDSPLLACFPCGPPSGSELNFRLFQNSAGRKQSQREIVAEPPRAEYIGQNFGEHSFKSNSCKYAIGLFTPSKRKSQDEKHSKKSKKSLSMEGQLQLYPVSGVFSVRQRVKKLKTEDEKAAAEDKKQKPAVTDAEKVEEFRRSRHMLIESFGSRKSKRAEKQMLSGRVSLEHDHSQRNITQIMEKQLEVAQIDAGSWEVVRKLKEAQLPPFDPETEDVDQAYLIELMLTDEERDQLDVTVMEKLIYDPSLAEKLPYKGYFPFVRYYLTTVFGRFVNKTKKKSKKKKNDKRTEEKKEEEEEEEEEKEPTGLSEGTEVDKDKLKYVLYLQYLLGFHNQPSKKKDVRSLRCKPLITDKIASEFLETSKESTTAGKPPRGIHTKSMEMKLKLHICVLALYLCSYSLTPKSVLTLAKDLKVPETTMVSYLKEVGCVKKKEKNFTLLPPLKSRFILKSAKARSKKRK